VASAFGARLAQNQPDVAFDEAVLHAFDGGSHRGADVDAVEAERQGTGVVRGGVENVADDGEQSIAEAGDGAERRQPIKWNILALVISYEHRVDFVTVKSDTPYGCREAGRFSNPATLRHIGFQVVAGTTSWRGW
jgi:hypothetical protein